MNKFDYIICPVSNIKVDNNVTRVTAFLVSLLLIMYLITGVPYIMAFLVLDFVVRAFGRGNYSLLRRISFTIVKKSGVKPKIIDQAPKLFAQRIGFVFSVIIVLLYIISLPWSLNIAGVLLIFTLLDSVFNYCVGCLVYHYLVLPFYRERI